MDSSVNYDGRRKSSCATVVPPPQQKNRKISIPLTINCKDAGRNVFYDTGSMTDMSPTTAVSSRRHLPIYRNNNEPQDVSFFSSIKHKILGTLFKKKDEENVTSRTSSQQEKSSTVTVKTAGTDHDTINMKQGRSATAITENSSNTTLGNKVRHSYSDPHLSPGSTAVGYDDDEERQGYFGTVPAKKKKTPRGWIAAVLMVIVGALIAVTFVLVGLGKALGGNSTVSSGSQSTSAAASSSSHITSSSLVPSSTAVVTSTFIQTTLPSPTIITTTTIQRPALISINSVQITYTIVPSPPRNYA